MSTSGDARASDATAAIRDPDEVAAQAEPEEDGYRYPEIVVRDGIEGKGVSDGSGPDRRWGATPPPDWDPPIEADTDE